MGQIFGGLVAYGIDRGARIHGSAIAPWKTVFMVNGFITLGMGILFLWIIPDSQLNARWLSERDRVLAVARVRSNQQGIGEFCCTQLRKAKEKESEVLMIRVKRKQALEEISSHRSTERPHDMGLCLLFSRCVSGYPTHPLRKDQRKRLTDQPLSLFDSDIPNGGMSNFFSQLIVSFGYTPSESLLYGTPGGAVEVVALIVCGYLGDKYGQRILWSMVGLGVGILGFVLIVALPLDMKLGRLIGFYLTLAVPCPFVALLSLISSNIAGYTKKTTVAACYLVAYCVGNIIGESLTPS